MIVKFDGFQRDELAECILSLKSSDDVIHIVNRSQSLDSRFWLSFLEGTGFLDLERRHLDALSNLSPRDWWEISYDPNNDGTYAHSKTAQPFHTDNAWFASPPELNFFIMSKQAVSGGMQLIYPVRRLLDDLESEDASLFNDLTTVEVEIKKGNEIEGNKTTIISLDEYNPKIYWNFYRVNKCTNEIENLCGRFFQYLGVKQNSSSVDRLDSQTGDSFCFNDTHILHARDSFVAGRKGDRVLLQSMWNYK
ncbi:hypothetical protein EOE67_15110 [Rheinheimera riviphila]|uniref:TauD/TfdA-like domain-containing protein n=1 Tax=Rheinheimera riviphila TaxID=1834037 RepID=A0A437QJ97_9GAMM|nr:TauD/TfdA family dioxygenase [Rheinheimera riviphila]RVU34570.1 hypothetical protein EOE67_15110 [Rheinheimera riviphila]